jgi:hypothetical protein
MGETAPGWQRDVCQGQAGRSGGPVNVDGGKEDEDSGEDSEFVVPTSVVQGHQELGLHGIHGWLKCCGGSVQRWELQSRF